LKCTGLELVAFELLSELVSPSQVIILLVNPTNSNADRIIREVQEAAYPSGEYRGVSGACGV
jgi:hypothetical protein